MVSYRLGLRDRRSSKTTSQSPSAFFTHCAICGVIENDPLFHGLDVEPITLGDFATNLCRRTDQQIHRKMDVSREAKFCCDPRSRTAIIHHNQEINIGIGGWCAAGVGPEEDYLFGLYCLHHVVYEGKDCLTLDHRQYHTIAHC
jgi:hypothetical protein